MKLILAVEPNGGIGYQNKLPWSNIQGDLLRFKTLTYGKMIIMGRNTWESLPKKPLRDRLNVIVTSSELNGDYATNVIAIQNIESLSDFKLDDAWIIGGAKLIESYWNAIHRIHLTRVHQQFDCDVFIDLVNLAIDFNLVSSEQCIDHTYEIWERK